MTEVKHTPGPWFANYDPDNLRPLEIVTRDADKRVAFLASDGNPADAMLMAAAPDLLAALEAALPWLDSNMRQSARNTLVQQMQRAIRLGRSTP